MNLNSILLNHRRIPAFTLLELMVVVAVMAILAGLLLPVISRSKDKGYRAVCINNLRQLNLAFELYRQDHEDWFPGPGSKQTHGPQPEDWIWWQYGRGVTNSTIARYVDGFKPELFTCPADKQALEMQGLGPLPNDPYRYSYALTSYDLRDGKNMGMATLITRDRKVYPFRHSQILKPEAKIMLAEEDRETIDDPRWVPEWSRPNRVTDRHDKKGVVAFADGHVENVLPEFGLDPANSQPGL